jgi:hypothetical protein
MAIIATNPVVVPAGPGATYNQWYMTILLVNATPITAPAQIRLQRSLTDGSGNTVLMPGPPRETQVTINLDLFAASVEFPQIAQALAAVVAAVEAYGAAKGLL